MKVIEVTLKSARVKNYGFQDAGKGAGMRVTEKHHNFLLKSKNYCNFNIKKATQVRPIAYSILYFLLDRFTSTVLIFVRLWR